MLEKIQEAQQFIQENTAQVNGVYQPTLHFSAQVGWINDPNGFVYDGEKVHLFYQYHPYSSKWGPMHWGHATSNNLISWTHLPIALAPSHPYDQSGIFSGTSIIENGKHKLYYTGHVDLEGKVTQTQCIAESSDGIHFTKSVLNPIIDASSMPEDSIFEDFRDPKIIKLKDEYILLAGSRTKSYLGQILMYSSKDGEQFTYRNRMIFPRKYGDVVECPDLLKIDGRDVLIFSTQKAILDDTVQNSFSVFAMLGVFNQEKYVFESTHEQVLDYGFDFYAPQTTQSERETLMIAWMNSWERSQITDLLNHHWAGCMTLPRVLSIQDNRLVQSLPSALYDQSKCTFHKSTYHLNAGHKQTLNCKDIALLEFDVTLKEDDELTIHCLNDGLHHFDLVLDGKACVAKIDRSSALEIIHSKVGENEMTRHMRINTKAHVSILMDKSCVEILINGFSMTSLFYAGDHRHDFNLYSQCDTNLENVKLYQY